MYSSKSQYQNESLQLRCEWFAVARIEETRNDCLRSAHKLSTEPIRKKSNNFLGLEKLKSLNRTLTHLGSWTRAVRRHYRYKIKGEIKKNLNVRSFRATGNRAYAGVNVGINKRIFSNKNDVG